MNTGTLDDTSRIALARRLWTKRAPFSLTSVLEHDVRFDSEPHGERTPGARWKDAAGPRTGRIEYAHAPWIMPKLAYFSILDNSCNSDIKSG